MRSLAVCLLVLTGCEQLPELPATFQYEVEFGRPVFVGWSVFAKGEKLGVITKSGIGWQLRLEAPAATPIEKVFEGAELRSPCGKVIPLANPIKPSWKDRDGKPVADEKKYKQSLYKYHLVKLQEKQPGIGKVMTIELRAQPAEVPEVTVPHPVLIARGGVTDQLTIGTMVVDLSVNRVEVAPDCGDDLPVKVGGTEIGVWSSKNQATFIALAEDACYRHRIVSYGESPYRDPGKLFKGRGVFPLGGEPGYFLTQAPTTVAVGRGTTDAVRSELDSAPCE